MKLKVHFLPHIKGEVDLVTAAQLEDTSNILKIEEGASLVNHLKKRIIKTLIQKKLWKIKQIVLITPFQCRQEECAYNSLRQMTNKKSITSVMKNNDSFQ